MLRIFLIGFMGCGKTTTGQRLAKKIGWQWFDTDKFIEQRFHKNISEIFLELGEEKFREIEHKILIELAEFQNVVISCGGGLPCFYNNMKIMKNAGKTFYLKATPEKLFERLQKAKIERILLKDKADDELLTYIFETLKKRDFFYEQADFTINTSDNFQHLNEILKLGCPKS